MTNERQGTIMLVMILALLAGLIICGPELARGKPPLKVTQKTKQVTSEDLLCAMNTHPGKTKGDVHRYQEFARLFVKNGRRWGVDPVIVACVAYIESGFRARPRPVWKTKCREKLVGSCTRRPGPCYPRYKKICRKVRLDAGESGILQSLWYDKSTRIGYKLCTGKKLFAKCGRSRKARRSCAKKRLSPPKIAVCVGTYELSKWKRWAYKGGHGRIPCWRYKRWKRKTPRKGWRWCPIRMKPQRKRNVRFFKRNPGLRQFFWVSFMNWGSNKWVGNGYPRAVLYCYKRLKRGIKENRLKAAQGNDACGSKKIAQR